jgi:predicted ABC-type ATPase
MSRAYIFSGLPGSGKSLISLKMVEKNSHLVIIGADEIGQMLKGTYPNFSSSSHYHVIRLMVVKIVQDIVRRAIDADYDFILDETLLKSEHREQWIKLIHSYSCQTGKSYKIILVIFPVLDIETSLKRRMENPKGITKERWKTIITNMSKTIETDYPDEFHEFLKQINFEQIEFNNKNNFDEKADYLLREDHGL